MKKLLGSLIIISTLCASTIHASTPKTYPDDFVTFFGQKLNATQVQSTFDLLNNFCTLVKGGETRHDTEKTNYFYDPQQSLFLMVLCEQKDKADIYLQHTDLSHYGVQCKGFTEDGDNCQKPLYNAVHKIYDNIVRDIFDSMTAQAYGYNSFYESGGGAEDLSQMSYEFLEKYGKTRTESLCSKDKKNECVVPETINQLTKNIRQARKLSQKLTWIRSKIKNKLPPALCETKHKQNSTYTIISCGLGIDSKTIPSITDQHNLLANELLRYTTFVEYYAHHLSTNPAIQPSQNTTEITKINDQGKTHAAILHKNQQASLHATHHSTIQINQIHNTYPTHIHLLAQYEMIKKIRNNLAQIYTPLHQLYYKLRNVQAQG